MRPHDQPHERTRAQQQRRRHPGGAVGALRGGRREVPLVLQCEREGAGEADGRAVDGVALQRWWSGP
jgi:hypothetical protein